MEQGGSISKVCMGLLWERPGTGVWLEEGMSTGKGMGGCAVNKLGSKC